MYSLVECTTPLVGVPAEGESVCGGNAHHVPTAWRLGDVLSQLGAGCTSWCNDALVISHQMISMRIYMPLQQIPELMRHKL